LLRLAGLKDDYAHDGRVLFEVIREDALPRSIREHDETLSRLASAYKAINAPVGALGRRTLELSTRALAADDVTAAAVEERIRDITSQRNAIAGRMNAILETAAFDGTPVDDEDARELFAAAGELLESVE
jgi:hypothetical protein